jgi:RNA recognition motif-containing protein
MVTVFVGNLSWSTTNEGLQQFMSSSGIACVSGEVQSHADSGRSKGWGLAEFSTLEEAKAVMQALNNQELDGRPVNLKVVSSIKSADDPHKVIRCI